VQLWENPSFLDFVAKKCQSLVWYIQNAKVANAYNWMIVKIECLQNIQTTLWV